MPTVDSFNTSVTSVDYAWPRGVTGLERIMLSAHGDLQRLLSAFFSLPITIERVFAETGPRTKPASPAHPITQKRQVHLLCASRIVCVATSTVTITSPECERLFLDEKYAIGQLFRRMQTTPRFALLEVGLDDMRGEDGQARRNLWRRYTLDIEGIVCDIVEAFPDREMFVEGEAWLKGQSSNGQAVAIDDSRRYSTYRKGIMGSSMKVAQGEWAHFIFICLAILVLFFFPAERKLDGQIMPNILVHSSST